VLTSADQFRPGPPPALTSETWKRDLAEIRAIGGKTSTARTAEQTAVAQFWEATAPTVYWPLARSVATAAGRDASDNARLFAVAAMAMDDALIAVFDAKYTYNLWRPVTAIRHPEGDHPDRGWLPFVDTPMHPEYPCAHCIGSAAVGAVLQNIVGNEFGEFSLSSSTAPGVTRKWTRVQDYSDEVANARIYAGFHYRFSTEVGKDMGRKIGELTVATQLRGVEALAKPAR
jgi:hypothetical protein